MRSARDPAFGRTLRVAKLGPEQAEAQTRIRRQRQAALDQLNALEAQIARLREHVLQATYGRTSFKAPTLDAIHRSVRNMSALVRERHQQLDSLAARLEALRRSTPSARAESTPPPASTPRVPDDRAIAAASSALNAELAGQRLRTALLAARSRPLLTTPVVATDGVLAADSSDLSITLARGPLTSGQIKRRPKPATTTARAPIAISFAAVPSPSPATTTTQDSPLAGRHTMRENRERKHGAAVKFVPTSGPPKSSSGFSFGDLPAHPTSSSPSLGFVPLRS